MDAVRLGQLLAERHRDGSSGGDDRDGGGAGGEPVDQVRSLLNYAESPHDGDWTLRSSLTRLAQPHPARVGRVLDLTRRLDGPLHHVRKTLEQHPVTADRGLTPDTVAGQPISPVRDIRTADLARLAAAGLDLDGLLAGYEAEGPLTNEERRAVPLLVIAVRIEALAETLSAWAQVGPADPPLNAVDRFVATVQDTMDQLGVPEEIWPPQGMRRSGRG
ncbi:MAG: hypothetical protein AAF531_07685 [Actinomycetota bacterium]